MSTLTEAEKIARYDLERSGELYTKPVEPQMPADASPLLTSLLGWAGEELAIARACDQVIADTRAAQPSTAAPDEDEEEAEIVDTPIPMGTIAACAVTGLYRDDGSLFEAKLSWNGLLISVLGSTDIINVDGFDITDCIGDMTFAMWGKVKELAHTDVVEQLIALARTKAVMADEEITLAPQCDQVIAEHRQDRMLTILETIAALPEREQSETLNYMEGLLDGMMGKVRADRVSLVGYQSGAVDGRILKQRSAA